MEKLQQALEKARADRANTPQGVAPQGHPEGTAEAADKPVDVWATLAAATPDPYHLTRNRIMTQSHCRDATPFDILRTKLVMQMRKNGWRRLAITSATPACGKSTIAGNLAFGLSRQTDLRAILLEMDLRSPSLGKLTGLQASHDITSVLSGKTPFAKQALRVRGNVALGLARERASDPTRFLMSQQTEDVIIRIEEEFQPDLMLFDTPPVLVSDDTRAFLSKVDCALIVARAEKTTISQIDTCEREIAEHTNVVGVVLNHVRFADNDVGYGYGYGED